MNLRARHFGQGCADQHRDGDDERGELLGVAVIVVCVGIEGGTFVLLYLHWGCLELDLQGDRRVATVHQQQEQEGVRRE